jgi:DNA-binding beta-propeller fold protein YncE
MRALNLILSCLLLAGCAQQPALLRYDQPAGQRLMFPPPPDVPRYLYLGELTGERNFVVDGQAARGALRTAFEWLVGLAAGPIRPLELQRPQSGVTDESGRVYVTDASRQAVFVFDEAAGQLQIWDMAEEAVRFQAPVGIALGANSELLVADAELARVVRLNREGQPVGSFGQGVLQRPTGLARDAKRGVVYVADARAHDIKLFDDRGQLLEVLGQRGGGDGEFNFPTHLAFAHDRLYVTDSINARVQVFGRDDSMKWKFGERGLYVGNLVRPKGVAVDDEGFIYVVESLYDTLLVFNNKGSLMLSIGGAGKDAGHFYLPAGVWSDSRNRIYVADMFNGRVAVFQFLGGDTR